MLTRFFRWGVVMLAAVVLPACGSKSQEDAAPAPPKPVAPGAAADVAGASIRVADAISASRIVLPGGSAYEPDGTFVLVRLALENAGGETARISNHEAVLLGADGERYEVDKQGTLAIATGNTQTSHYDPSKPNGLYGPIDVMPGTPLDLIAVFDVPADSADGLRLQLGPKGSTRVFELEADASVNPELSDLGVRLVQ